MKQTLELTNDQAQTLYAALRSEQNNLIDQIQGVSPRPAETTTKELHRRYASVTSLLAKVERLIEAPQE